MPEQRSNEAWLADLRGPDSAFAIEDLREIVLRGLRAALAARIRRDLDFVVEDFVQEALLKILDNVDSFRGESKFTTWALKIAIHVAYSELRRRRWQDVSLQELMTGQDGEEFTPAFLTDPEPGPESAAARTSMLDFVEKMIDEELTERQRIAVIAIMFNGMPISEVARRMDTNRNALYKLVHDARKRLQKRMVENGISAEEVLAAFES
ncbi:MAG TPA: sigma-70 family RNA polymerase sigma factor [Anaerolineales bacterium]|nr:sigma-70 family RNA polymerase sigma factor [Anaerolineales bacterium]